MVENYIKIGGDGLQLLNTHSKVIEAKNDPALEA